MEYIHCLACDIVVNKIQLYSHINGKKHKRTMKNTTEYEDNNVFEETEKRHIPKRKNKNKSVQNDDYESFTKIGDFTFSYEELKQIQNMYEDNFGEEKFLDDKNQVEIEAQFTECEYYQEKLEIVIDKI